MIFDFCFVSASLATSIKKCNIMRCHDLIIAHAVRETTFIRQRATMQLICEVTDKIREDVVCKKSKKIIVCFHCTHTKIKKMGSKQLSVGRTNNVKMTIKPNRAIAVSSHALVNQQVFNSI